MHLCIWHSLLPQSVALGDDHLQVTGIRSCKQVTCDSKITAGIHLEHVPDAEGNLELMQQNCWKSKNVQNTQSPQLEFWQTLLRGKKTFLNHSTVFPFLPARASIPSQE